MFLGHYGVALALKRAEPKLSLGTLFLSVQLLDVLWGTFLLLGWEHVRILPDDNPLLALQFYDYPISHSLAGAIGWGLAAAVVYYSWPTRDTSRHARAAAIVGLAVLSHWVLDLLVHVPDLPLAGNDSAKLGLGLWNHFRVSIAAELLALGAGAAVYVSTRSRRHPLRPVPLALILLVLVGTYAASLAGPPPPSQAVVGGSTVAFLLIMVGAAVWMDRAAAAVKGS